MTTLLDLYNQYLPSTNAQVASTLTLGEVLLWSPLTNKDDLVEVIALAIVRAQHLMEKHDLNPSDNDKRQTTVLSTIGKVDGSANAQATTMASSQ